MDLDKDVLNTVNFLPDQLWEAWEESRKVVLPETYKNFKRVLVCGMGGSALGGRVVKAYAAGISSASIDVLTDYSLPAYADRQTLIIASSYSGNTEESVSVLSQAVERKLPIFVIAAGGKLVDMARLNRLPVYVLNPKYNPSGQPRFAVGYSVGAIFGVLSKCSVLFETDSTVHAVVDFMKVERGEIERKAKEMAGAIHGNVPILVASEHLTGAVHVTKNQLNESAKCFSASFDIPELNHHLMEGLKNPREVTSKLMFVFFESLLYHERVQKRYQLTAEVVEKNGARVQTYKLTGDNKLKQIFELIFLGSFAQMQLGGLYGEDPIAIPWVDYFKEELG